MLIMKSPTIENIIVDEARKVTYVVMASRVLTDGEMYLDIRLALRRRAGNPLAKGERFVITSSCQQ
jgi:hypothetical protein